jgi:hypothetical protein
LGIDTGPVAAGESHVATDAIAARFFAGKTPAAAGAIARDKVIPRLTGAITADLAEPAADTLAAGIVAEEPPVTAGVAADRVRGFRLADPFAADQSLAAAGIATDTRIGAVDTGAIAADFVAETALLAAAGATGLAGTTTGAAGVSLRMASVFATPLVRSAARVPTGFVVARPAPAIATDLVRIATVTIAAGLAKPATVAIATGFVAEEAAVAAPVATGGERGRRFTDAVAAVVIRSAAGIAAAELALGAALVAADSVNAGQLACPVAADMLAVDATGVTAGRVLLRRGA